MFCKKNLCCNEEDESSESSFNMFLLENSDNVAKIINSASIRDFSRSILSGQSDEAQPKTKRRIHHLNSSS